jgi:hypothetical protein
MRLKAIVRGWQSRHGSEAQGIHWKNSFILFDSLFELENGNTWNSKSMNHWNDNQVPPQSTIVLSFAAAGWRGGSIVRLRRFRHRRALARERSSGRRSHTSLLRRREVLGDLLVRAPAVPQSHTARTYLWRAALCVAINGQRGSSFDR